MPDIVINPSLGKIDFFTVKGEQVTNSMRLGDASTILFTGALSASSITTGGGGAFVTSVQPTANYLSKFTGNSTIANSLVYDNGTNVGIGTTVPSASLHINSTTAGATLLRTDGTNGTLFSVVDDLSDSLMSVNNSAGLPVLEVFTDDRIVAGQYGQNDFVVINNKVGIGTNNPLAKLHVTGSSSVPSAIFIGNVGIGSTSPGALLDVNGLFRFQQDIRVNNGTDKLILSATSTTTELHSAGTTGIVFKNSGNNEIVRFDAATGNVGIGTTTPTGTYGKLSVAGGIRILDDNNAKLEIGRYSSGASNSYIKLGSNSNSLRITNNTDAADIFTIENGGNVGIGTSSPVTQLHVSGSLQIGNGTNYGNKFTLYDDFSSGKLAYVMRDLNSDDIFGLYCNSTTGEVRFLADDDDANTAFMTFQMNGSERMRITNAGSLLIGDTTQTYGPTTLGYMFGVKSQVHQSFISIAKSGQTLDSGGIILGLDTTAAYLWARENIPISFGTNNNEKVRIAADGNVGIGTSSPSNKTTIDADATGVSFADNAVAQLVIRGATDTTKRLGLGVDTTNNIGVIQAQKYGTAAYPLVLNPVGGNVGIGTTTTTDGLLSLNGTYPQLNINNPSTGSGVVIQLRDNGRAAGAIGHFTSTNYLQFSTAGQTAQITLTNIGNVGIGTTNPNSSLQVSGSVTIGPYNTLYSGTGVNSLNINATTYPVLAFYYGTTLGGILGAYSDHMALNTGAGGSKYISFEPGDSEIMRITAAGNVGIGTTIPGRKLHLYAPQSVISLSNTGTGAWSGLQWSVGNGAYTAYSGLLDDTGRYFIDVGSNGDDFTILQNGNVGIGTTGPAVKLHVDGFFISKTLWSDTAAHSYWGNYSTAYGRLTWDTGLAWINAMTGNVLYLGANGDNKHITIATSGNVGIGTTSPAAKLYVVSSGGPIARFDGSSVATSGATEIDILGPQSNGDLNLGIGGSTFTDATNNIQNKAYITAGTGLSGLNLRSDAGYVQITAGGLASSYEVARFTSTGNVGIGTTVPSASLHINSTTSGATLLRTDGTNGTLFSVVDDLSDSLMSVNNSAGLPVLEVFADDRIVGGQYGQNDLVVVNNKVGIGTNNPLAKLHVTGSASVPAAVFMGNVGIGTTSFVYSNANRGDIEVYGSTDALISLRNGTANSYLQKSGNDFYFNNGGAGFIAISTNGSERMQISSDGNLYLGTSTTSVTNGGIVSYASSVAQFAMGHATGVASGTAYAGFQYNGTQIGSILQSGTTGVTFNTTSDYRLKENIQPLSSGLVRVNSLKPSIYNWKSDGSNGEGFLAHELAEVVPIAVTGEKDAVNKDGTINPQSVDLSKVVPILVAAIQELSAKVKTLEAKVQILESK